MTTAPAIEIPRLPNERNERYEARTAYLVAGADRDLRSVAQKFNKSVSLIARWSAADRWGDLSQDYDNTLATIAAQRHAQQYLADLEENRARYGKAGKRLYNAASVLLTACEQAIAGKVIKGEDGVTYAIPAMKITPMALAVAMRALTVAADLEAHALRVADLLPRLTGEGDE